MQPASPIGRISRPTRARCLQECRSRQARKASPAKNSAMAQAGIDDILSSYNLLGDEKMARLGALQAKANMTVAADNPVVIADLPKAAAASGRELSVVVECDTGRKRAGVETPAEAIALAREIAASKGLHFAGFMMYPTETGWADAQKFYDEALAGVRAHGLEATIVSTG